jgi:F420-dependent oxidoreductase-like protein
VRFSLWPTNEQPWPDLLSVARFAEATGWDGVWIFDHFMPDTSDVSPERLDEELATPTLECWTVLAGLATVVPRVRLGALVSSVTYRHPAVLANMAATLDHLSGGRAVLGVGAGWQVNEHQAYGIRLPPPGRRLDDLEEATEILHHLLRDARTTVEGRRWQVRDAACEPKPLQDPMPLLIGGGGERRTLRIVARCADEWNVWGLPERLRAKGEVLDRHCEELGRDPSTIRRSAQVLVELTDAAGTEPPPARPPTVRGTPAQVLDVVAGYAAAGVDEFILPDWELGTGARREDAIARFWDEIARPLR